MTITRAGLFGGVSAYLGFLPKTPAVEPPRARFEATVAICRAFSATADITQRITSTEEL